MSRSPFSSSRLGSKLGPIFTGGAIALVLFFCWWTYLTNFNREGAPAQYLDPIGSLYNLSVDGYLAGQLSFVPKPSPELLALPDPYDAAKNAAYAIREASMYHGKYYLYFGPVPALTFFLPVRLITGVVVGDGVAMIVFALGAFLVGVLILMRLRRLVPGTGSLLLIMGIVGLGLNTYIGHFLRRPAVFEVAIISADFWLLLAIYFLVTYFAKGAPSRTWGLVGAGLSLGLAVGCRYSYAPCCLVLLLPLLHSAREGVWLSRDAALVRARRFAPGLAAFAAMIGLLLVHNYLRFDNPLEFGQKYQLTAVTISQLKLMSASYIPHNFNYYFLSFISPDVIFPFFHEFSNQPIFDVLTPRGYHAVWNSVGVFNAPFLLVGILFPPIFIFRQLRQRASGPEVLTVFAFLCIGIPAAINIGVLLMFCGIVVRYLVDFTPLLALLAAFSCWVMAEALKSRPVLGRWATTAMAILILYGVAVNLALSMEGEYQSVERHSNPGLFHRMEDRFEFVPQLAFSEADYGAVSLKLKFPLLKDAAADPLVTTGRGWLSDVVSVAYPAEGSIQFVYYHDLGDGQGIKGDVIAIDPSQAYQLEIGMGSLYPRTLPFLVSRGYDVTRAQTLQVKLNGKTVMEAKGVFYNSLPSQVQIGRNKTYPIGPYFNPSMINGTFRGVILERKRLPFLASTQPLP